MRSILVGGLKAYNYFTYPRHISKEKVIRATEKHCDRSDKSRFNKLVKSCYRDCRKYLSCPDEYYLYHFDRLVDEQKKTFQLDLRRNEYHTFLNEPERARLFKNKSECYKLFREFYKRNVFEYSNEVNINDIRPLLKYDRVIIKPLKGSLGKKIHICDTENPDTLLENINNSRPCVVEEIVKQCDFMSKLHPESVNTVRVVTFLQNDDVVKILYAVLRMGRGTSIVDNGGSGGLLMLVDVETGKVISDATDENTCCYEYHEGLGIRFMDLQIPKWNELLDLSEKLARIEPTVRLVGFDLALTEDGWVMIEGNDNPQPGKQIILQQGAMPEFRQMIKEIPRVQ